MEHADSELEYKSNLESYNEAYHTPAEVEVQPLPEALMDMPIIVSSPSID